MEKKTSFYERLSIAKKRDLAGILFLLPITCIMLTFLVIPVALAFQYSFTEWDGISSHKQFVGGQNYLNLLQAEGIQHCIINTVILFTLGTILINLLSLLLSLALVNSGLINRNFHKTAFFLPTVLSPVVVALVGKAMFFYDGGMINELLIRLGMGSLRADWLGRPGLVMLSLTLGYVWFQIGISMVIYLAGLQNISVEMYESSQIDGANKWQQAKYITLPMLAPAITVNVIYVTILALKVFDYPFALTGGGPGYFSEVIPIRIFYYAFRSIAYGEGTALSVVLTVFILLISLIQVGYLRKREEIY